MTLKPWYKIVTPREDLRESRPLDAAEFAVHLDDVREYRGPDVYKKPDEFFKRTFLTQNLVGLASEVVRRLSGEITETSAVFNLATQFGGGKTHALTLLYHIANLGFNSLNYQGVGKILKAANVNSIPKAEVAAFVGTEFDTLEGRGGDDGTPKRITLWGEIAYQIGKDEAFKRVKQHEEQKIAPGGDVIRKILPSDRPCLILIDELMNYINRTRSLGLAGQVYSFLQNLSEVARGLKNVVLVVSIPASVQLEMTAEDEADYNRLDKLLDRISKSVLLSSEGESSEIIRRRLFEWEGISSEARKTIADYADWIIDNRQLIPSWFPVDNARETLEATYPFHPMVISVFERKWQALPRFQRTRGILRLLALWVSKAYSEGYKGAHKDPLIGLGTAPLEDSMFRAAMFEQLGETKLEGPVITDIAGKKEAHALRLDAEAAEDIKKARLHRKIATTIFFESNGGQTRTEATVPEVRLSVAEPDLDIGHVEMVLEGLGNTCYYLAYERNKYRFSTTPNLNKLLSDRRANIKPTKMRERINQQIQKVFSGSDGITRIYFPQKSIDIPDRPVLTLCVLSPEWSMEDEDKTLKFVDGMTREYGNSARTYKNALVWCVSENETVLKEVARTVLAWEVIEDEGSGLRLDNTQKRQLAENLRKSERDLKEAVWRSYKFVLLLGKDNSIRQVNLGLVHSSSAVSLIDLIRQRLQQDDEISPGISPVFLTRNWPPAFKEWSIKAIRDAIFASPQFPRLINAEVIRDTIVRGVADGILAYVGKTASGEYEPFYFGTSINHQDVEITDDMYIIPKEAAEEYEKSKENDDEPPVIPPTPIPEPEPDDDEPDITIPPATPPEDEVITQISWRGEIPAQKWMNFYTKVLSKYSTGQGLSISVGFKFSKEDGISKQQIEETKSALRELGLGDEVNNG